MHGFGLVGYGTVYSGGFWFGVGEGAARRPSIILLNCGEGRRGGFGYGEPWLGGFCSGMGEGAARRPSTCLLYFLWHGAVGLASAWWGRLWSGRAG